MAYEKQIWDTTSYVNPTRMNHIEKGISNASSDAARATEYFDTEYMTDTQFNAFWQEIIA